MSFLELIGRILDFFSSIELKWKRWESRTDFIGPVASLVRFIVQLSLAVAFSALLIYLFFSIVTSDIFQVIIELIKYLILIFIFGSAYLVILLGLNFYQNFLLKLKAMNLKNIPVS